MNLRERPMKRDYRSVSSKSIEPDPSPVQYSIVLCDRVASREASHSPRPQRLLFEFSRVHQRGHYRRYRPYNFPAVMIFTLWHVAFTCHTRQRSWTSLAPKSTANALSQAMPTRPVFACCGRFASNWLPKPTIYIGQNYQQLCGLSSPTLWDF